MLGALLAFISAATFGFNNASVRRGVITGTVAQAIAITVPLGLPLFVIPLLLAGELSSIGALGWGQDRVLISGHGEERTRRSRRFNHKVTGITAILNDAFSSSSGWGDKTCLSYSPYNQKVNKMGTL